MSTIIVNGIHRFKNAFSSQGRAMNKFYKEINGNGCKHIRERVLPDNSRVLLAYENPQAKTAAYSFKLNADGSMEQAKRQSLSMFSLVRNKVSTITKIFANKDGVKTKEVLNKSEYDSSGNIIRKKIKTYTDDYTKKQSYEKYGGILKHDGILYPNVTESIIKESVKNSNKYAYIKQTDGTKTFVKNINGVDYIFTTAK